jgi:hypothetical protein
MPLTQLSGSRHTASDGSPQSEKLRLCHCVDAAAVSVSKPVWWDGIVVVSGDQHAAAGSTFRLHPFFKLVNLLDTQFTFRATAENAEREFCRVRLMKTEKPDLIKGFARLLGFSIHHQIELIIGVMVEIRASTHPLY